MSKLDKVERGISKIINTVFAKTFRAQIQPVELFGVLKNEMDIRAVVYSRDRVLVPSRYLIEVHPADYQHLLSLGAELMQELTGLLDAHAQTQGYKYSGSLSLALVASEKLTKGLANVEATKSSALWRPFLRVDHKQYPLGPPLIIGRSSQADIYVDDPAASRRHAEISWDGEKATIVDLGSTNGFKVNGIRCQKTDLENNSIIIIGNKQLLFLLVPVEDTPGK